jgi:hypothetical protein
LGRANAWINSRPNSTIEWLLFACIMVIVWGLDTHGTNAGTGDEPHYQIIAHSLVFDRDLDLSNDYSDPANLVGGGKLDPGLHAIRGKDGRLRPVHDIGLPLLFSPYFGVAYWIAEHSPDWIPPRLMARAHLNPSLVLRHLLSLAMIALTACMAVVLFRVFQVARESRALVLFWTLLFVLSPPLLSHSYLFYTEIPSALVVTVCWRSLNTPFPKSRLQTALLGAAVGFLLLLHIRNVGLVLGLTVLFIGRFRRLERWTVHAAWFLAPVACWAAVRTAVNFAFWGHLVTNPHAAMVPTAGVAATATEIATRAFGLLMDQERGLLPYAPIYLLALPGFLVLWRTDRTSFREASLLVLAYLVPVLVPWLNRHGWDGGFSPAARFLVPVAPILIAAGFRYVARLRRIPIALAVLSVGQVTLDAVYWQHPRVLWNVGSRPTAFAILVSPSRVDVAAWLPCWHSPSPYSVVVSALAVVAWAVVSVRAVNKCLRPHAAGRVSAC